MTNNWWQNASTEARLAQIDGAIDLGMTVRQTCLASGMPYDDISAKNNPVRSFAYQHGRTFGRTSAKARVISQRKHAPEKRRRSYLAGESREHWDS